jgi:transcriptional regulator with XRE-family HTH domain
MGVDDAVRRTKAVLKERGWSTRELGRRAGISEEHAVKILQRGLSTATAEKAQQIADALGVSLRWLLTGEGPQDVPGGSVDADGPERYAHRAEAIEFLGSKVDPRAPRAVSEWKLFSSGDPSRTWWIEQILEEEQRILGRERDPETAERADEDSARKVSALAHAQGAHLAKERDKIRAETKAARERGEPPLREPPPYRPKKK